MILSRILPVALAAFLCATPLAAMAAPVTGEPAPDFTATGVDGETYTLSDLKGNPVVLEWHNPECPYVKKHYDTGNMQGLQEKYTAQDVTWLTIVSSAEGKQGYAASDEEAKAIMDEQDQHATTRILDPSGEIGQLYGAQTTPHMYVIDADGVLVYQGAIDSDSSFKPESIEGATNYVTAALDALAAGEPVETASTQPYGCSVKY